MRRIQFEIAAHVLRAIDDAGRVELLTTDCYAGNGDAINDPTCCGIKEHGPLPCGLYEIGAPVDRPESVGRFALPLTPRPGTDMLGRGGFFVHGDNPAENFTASDGCIVAPPAVRERVAQFDVLEVIA